MKTSFIALFMVGGLLLGNNLLANEGHHTAQATSVKKAMVKQQTNCPVMKANKINKKLYVDVKGKRIYVCCKGCLPMVKRNPEKYLKQLKQSGVVVANIPTAKK